MFNGQLLVLSCCVIRSPIRRQYSVCIVVMTSACDAAVGRCNALNHTLLYAHGDHTV